MTRQYPVSSFTIKINIQLKHRSLVWSLIFCLFCSVVFLKQVNCNSESDNLDEDEIKESEALAFTEQYQNHLKKIGENLVQKFGDSVRNALAPARNYYSLVNRYHVWFKNYKNLEKASKGKMKKASDVLREEYARVDKILYEEECSSSDPKDISDDDLPQKYEEKLESIDFVFNVLRKVIDKLEKSLKKLESEQNLKVKKPENMGLKLLLEDYPPEDKSNGKEEFPMEVKKTPEIDDEQVKMAMERVKKSVLKAATNVVANEAMVVANLAIVSTAINSMSSLSYLAPIVTLLGSANTPLTVWYLRNLELRAGLAVINRVNPLSFLNCNLKSRKEIN